MQTIKFSDAAVNPSLLANFDPATDILLFADNSAAQVKVTSGTNATTFSVGNASVTVDVNVKAIAGGTDSFVRFIDGSVLLIGDATSATVADDLANQLITESTDGNDQLFGLGGNDTLSGGLGDDVLYGNAGDDVIGGNYRNSFPSFAPSTIESGDDTVYAGKGDDVVSYNRSEGHLMVYGNLGNDSIYGSDGASKFYGGQGNDFIQGGLESDTIYGNLGDDEIYDYGGDNVILAGQGNDTIEFGGENAGNSVVYGNAGDDLIEAGYNGDTLYGGQGNDTIVSANGDDLVIAGAGNDLIVIEAGNIMFPGPNQISISGAEVTVWGGADSDTLNADDLGYTNVQFMDFNDDEDVVSLTSTSAATLANNAYGGAITDSDNRGNLFKAAAIILNTNDGAVTLVGGAGQTLDGDNLKLSDGSVFVYNVGGAAGSFDGSSASDFMIAGDNGDTLTAGANEDTLIGGEGNDLFVMGAYGGDDNLQGGLGDDSVTATINPDSSITFETSSIEHFELTWGSGTGNSFVSFDQAEGLTVDASSLTVGQDVGVFASSVGANVSIETGTGDDTLIGSNTTIGGDTLNGGDGDDTALGGAGNDIVNGDAGEDHVNGGAGADTLSGGGGADTFIFASEDSGFTTATVDHITDFSATEDRVQFGDTPNAVFDQRLVDLSSATTLLFAAGDAYDASTGIDSDDVVLFVYGGRTYAYVNDGDSDFSSSDDLLIDIAGFTGTITTDNFVSNV